MRKEILWVIVIGILFGLIIGFGAWRINTSIKKEPITTQASPTPSSANTSEFKITLDKPENDDVVTSDTIAVSGITKSMSWIAISGEKGNYVLQAGEDGIFSQDVDLTGGINQIKITAFDPSGNQSVQKVLVVYSSSFQVSSVPSSSPSDTSTASAIRQAVAQKVAQAMSKPKAYIGVVTDIADSTIEIKSSDSLIEQISVAGDNISVINDAGTNNNKTVKLTDIAIGDFIVAMGYVNSESVLLAQRILVTDQITEPKIDAFFAKVTNTSKKSIDVTGIKDGSTVTLTPGTKTDIESYDSGKLTTVKLSSINDGDLVIYISDSTGTPPLVDSVFVVQKAQ